MVNNNSTTSSNGFKKIRKRQQLQQQQVVTRMAAAVRSTTREQIMSKPVSKRMQYFILHSCGTVPNIIVCLPNIRRNGTGVSWYGIFALDGYGLQLCEAYGGMRCINHKGRIINCITNKGCYTFHCILNGVCAVVRRDVTWIHQIWSGNIDWSHPSISR